MFQNRTVSSFCGIRFFSFPFYYCKIQVYEPRYSTGSEMYRLFLTQFCILKLVMVIDIIKHKKFYFYKIDLFDIFVYEGFITNISVYRNFITNIQEQRPAKCLPLIVAYYNIRSYFSSFIIPKCDINIIFL